ncbi:gas vesicle protein K [Streptomyces sp. NPDC048291]|uniref:gas vesicle protein K n=1 Tax=Streptomyces sp. NPDC048291 TaxID=3365530 RepID=UPI0037189571
MTGTAADRHPGPDPPDRPAEVTAAAARAFRLLPAVPDDTREPGLSHPARRIGTDPDTVERDLVRLGDLTEEQEERLGSALMVLHDRMSDLSARYGLTMEDLNLDLGPLGTLLPPTRPD